MTLKDFETQYGVKKKTENAERIISPVLINFLRKNMSMWETTLNLTHQNGNLKSKPIKINSDIFQGDPYHRYFFVYP